jgi:hypothetical protein
MKKFLDYENMMKNLGILYDNFSKENKVCLLAAISNQGGLQSFRKYGFEVSQNQLSYAKELEKNGEFIPKNERKKVKDALEKRRKTINENKKCILTFLENNNEGSSIPLPKNSFFIEFLIILNVITYNNLINTNNRYKKTK